MPRHQQIVMDHSGDTRHDFDPDATEELAAAMARFDELTKGKGMTAYKRNGNGTGEVLRGFDATAEETVFRPRLVGG